MVYVIPQAESLEHGHGAEGGVAHRDQGTHVLRVQRLQGREVLEGVRVEGNKPAKNWNFCLVNNWSCNRRRSIIHYQI